MLVVDDSSFVRKALLRIFSSDPELHVVGLAADGRDAVRKVRELGPDVVTMDVLMPGLDGIEALKQIMETRPVPVLMLSQVTREGAELTLKALDAGAMDFVDKSTAGIMDLQSLGADIIARIKAIAGHRPKRLRGLPEPSPYTPSGAVDIVALASSTGGPPALQYLLQQMPSNLQFGVLILQHMPQGFTAMLASRLDALCRITVREARDGEAVRPGLALVAPSGLHMTAVRGKNGLEIKLDAKGEGSAHKPSADVLFGSLAASCGHRAIGVVLTGMGSDGAAGLLQMRKKGAITIAQDEATSVIYGMPRVAAQTGAADMVLPLQEIAPKLLALG